MALMHQFKCGGALVVMRRGCNPRLRHALYHMARVAMPCDAHFNSV